MEEKYILDKMDEWSEGFDPKKLVRLDNKIAHKVNTGNIFVSRIEQMEEGDADVFLSQLAIDSSHPYYFEHDYDHVPGMMLIEAGRQVGTAIAHLFYEVPFDTVFILNEMNVRFFKFVELTSPVFIRSMVRNKLLKRDRLIQMEHDGYFIQDHHEVAYMGGTWQMYDRRIIERFRRSGQNTTLTIG